MASHVCARANYLEIYRTQLSDGLLLVLALAGLSSQLLNRALEGFHVGDERTVLLQQRFRTEISIN